MFCPKCGADRDEKDKFCRNCGFEFSEEKPEVKISAETLKKAKFYKHSLRVIFCAFSVLLLLFCFMSVTAYPFYGGSSVYGLAFGSGFMNGLDGHWDNAYFFMTMFLNIFKSVDFVVTPCALTVFMLFFCICFSIAFLIVTFSKKRKPHTGAEVLLLVWYALFIIIFSVMILGVIYEYEMPLGAAPIMLLLLTLAAFVSSVIIYVKRKKFYRANPEI